MAFTVYDFIAAQLRAASPESDWNIEGIDRAQELATMLVDRVGVRDITRLILAKVTQQSQQFEWSAPTTEDALAFLYEGRQFGYIGTNSTPDIQTTLQKGRLVAWSAAGHGNVSYYIKPKPGGFAIACVWGSSSDASSVAQDFKIMASIMLMVVMPAAGIAVAGSLGAAVLGPTLATAYPALATAVGNVAIAAAFNGGDIKGAVKSAALSYIGGQAGAFVGANVNAVADVEILGKMAEAGTRAFVAGGDPKRAAGLALLQNAGGLVDAFEAEKITMTDEELEIIYQMEFANPGDSGGIFTFDENPGQSVFNADDVYLTAPESGGYIAPQIPIPEIVVESAPPPVVDQGAFSGINAREVINTISSAALSALNVVGAYRKLDAAGGAMVNTQARAVSPSGTVVSALDNGTVQTRSPSGQVTITRPPAGQAQSTTNGNVVVNNGDGTFTLISPNGQTRVIQYGSESKDSGISWPLLLGGAGLLITLLK